MPAPIPEHLFVQADGLSAPRGPGAPRQTDLRRAISTAYYGCFHHALQEMALRFLGGIYAGPEYALVYRKPDHKTLRSLCVEAQRATPGKPYQAYWPRGGFGPALREYAEAIRTLQEQRQVADYDPTARFRTSDVVGLIALARRALDRFRAAPEGERKLFLTLLLCPPRS